MAASADARRRRHQPRFPGTEDAHSVAAEVHRHHGMLGHHQHQGAGRHGCLDSGACLLARRTNLQGGARAAGFLTSERGWRDRCGGWRVRCVGATALASLDRQAPAPAAGALKPRHHARPLRPHTSSGHTDLAGMPVSMGSTKRRLSPSVCREKGRRSIGAVNVGGKRRRRQKAAVAGAGAEHARLRRCRRQGGGGRRGTGRNAARSRRAGRQALAWPGEAACATANAAAATASSRSGRMAQCRRR